MLSSRKSYTPKIISCTSENINASNHKPVYPQHHPSASLCETKNQDHSKKLGCRKDMNFNEEIQYCENHSTIKATYVSRTHGDEQQVIFYCTKCASLLADQGFEVLHLSQLQKKPNTKGKSLKQSQIKLEKKYFYQERHREIDQFLQTLNEKLQYLEGSSSQVKDILISSQEFYGQQIEQINEYFQTIIQSLELQKNKCYNHILLERQNAEKATRSALKKFTEGQKEIQAMIADINDNLDSVYSVTWENYQLVLETFDKRLIQIDKIIEQSEREGISDVEFRKIQFAGVPDSINSLSEIIIQNSFGGSILEGIDPDDCFSDGSYEQKSIFERLKANQMDNNKKNGSKNQYIQTQKSSHQRHNSLIFSFDADAMKEHSLRISEGQDSFEEEKHPKYGNNFLRKAPDHDELDYDEQFDDEPIMRNKKMHTKKLLFSDEGVQNVEGIQQVQEVDVLEMSEQYLIQ